MLKNLRKQIAFLIAPDAYDDAMRDIDKRIEEKAGQRIAATLSQMDPFEPLMREYGGIFTKEYQHPESQLDAKGQLLMMMWGYRQKEDPSFKHLTEWILNTQGNHTIKQPNLNVETILYGRAQIASTMLFIKEVGRLSSLYEDILEKQRDMEEFNSTSTVE